jgi:olefin beta-lactone synthetase
MTFGELDREADVLARGLVALGIGEGTRVALLVTPGPDLLALAFALAKAGAVPVVVDPGLGRARVRDCLDRAAPEAFIGVPRAHLARLVLGWARRSVRTSVVVGGPRSLIADVTLDSVRAAGDRVSALPALDPRGPAMVAFTSGSTGVPKGVLYRRDQLAAQLDVVRELFGWRPGDVDMPTTPLLALFGPALGVTVVIPPMNFSRPARANPRLLARIIREHRVGSMFGSPALLDTLSRWSVANGERLASPRLVVTAGAPVSAELLRRCRDVLADECELLTPYGATEALPITNVSSRELLGETVMATTEGAGVCVGRAVPGAEVEIVAITDELIASWGRARPVADGEVGEIVVRAPWVSATYLNDAPNTAAAKIPVADGTFFHRTGDVGYRDDRGRLWYCGRRTHRVVTPTNTLFTARCEGVIDTHPAVFRSALVGPRVDGTVRPTSCVELESGFRDKPALRRELLALAARHACTREIRHVLVHPGFPVDVRHNAKIDREKLTVWAGKRL